MLRTGLNQTICRPLLHPVHLCVSTSLTILYDFYHTMTMFSFLNNFSSQTRSSTSSNQGKSPSDVKPFRRRKSTSAKAAKPRFTFFASSFSTGHPSGSRNPPLEDVESSIESAYKLTHTASSRARLPPSVLLPKINGYDTPTESRQNLEFLPADPHFIVKGEGTSSCLPLAHRGKKHHAFPPEKIPYPRNYEREVVDL